MGFFDRFRKRSKSQSTVSMLSHSDFGIIFEGDGYVPLARNPDVILAVNKFSKNEFISKFFLVATLGHSHGFAWVSRWYIWIDAVQIYWHSSIVFKCHKFFKFKDT